MSAATAPIAPLAAAEIDVWDLETDVAIVGLGIAGTCAAISAFEAGARVIAFERAGGAGGTSALSGGLIYLGGGTPIQEALGFHDTPENMERFLLAACGPDADADKVRGWLRNAAVHAAAP